MVITRKFINNIYCIDIPDEGVIHEKDKIEIDFNNLNSYTAMKYQILSEMQLYHINVINDILRFIENNQLNYNYEFLGLTHYSEDVNEVSSFKVKGDKQNIIKLSKAISRLINNKKQNYIKEVQNNE